MNDPYESTNRAVFDFNQKVDGAVLKRAAETYNRLPDPIRAGIHNVLANLGKPVTFVNELLQGEAKRARQSAVRFTVNSTFGLGGLMDVASKHGIPDHDEDFGQTLAVWGVPEGPYLVLPIIGPDPPRDFAGHTADGMLNHAILPRFNGSRWVMNGRTLLGMLDTRARNLATLESVERSSIDFYAATRSLYRQYRDNEIRNGAPPSSGSDE